nr:uncharacterized protein LOC129256900 [Lytechinus pictus]
MVFLDMYLPPAQGNLKLMAVEWDADKKSESSSIVSSELSSEDISPSSDPLDSDESTDSPPNGPIRREYTREYSLRDSGNGDSGDSGIYRRDSDRSHKLDTSNCGDLDTINEEDLSAIMRPKTIVTDLETCKDFVQSLAEQVQAMQEALRKSKDDLLEVDEEELEEERDMVVDGMEEVVKHDNDRVPEVEDIYETTPMIEVRVNSERNEGHQHDGHQNGGNIFWESEPLSVRERVMQIDRATLGREHRLSYRGRSSPIERDSYASRESHFSLLSHESHSSHLSRGSQESHQSLKSSLDSHASHASFGHHELHGTFDLPGMRESYSSHGSNKSYDSKSSSLVNGDHSPIPKRISNESQPRDRSRGTPSPPPSKFTNGPLRSSNPVNNVQKITNGTTSQSNTNGTSGKPRPPARQNIPPTKPIPPARPNGITKMNGQSLPNGVVKPARTSGPPIRSTPTSQVVDDGGYETPIQCKPIPPARNMAGQKQRSSHVQADYEEVIQLPGNVCDNQTTGLCVRTSKKDDYIHVSSTYEVTDIQATGNQPSRNDSDKSTNGTSNSVQRTVEEEGAIYEFPPDTCLEEEVPRPVSAMEEEPPKECFEEHIPPEPVIYKYDGPEVFGDNIKTEPARFEERDAIKKWDPVSIYILINR